MWKSSASLCVSLVISCFHCFVFPFLFVCVFVCARAFPNYTSVFRFRTHLCHLSLHLPATSSLVPVFSSQYRTTTGKFLHLANNHDRCNVYMSSPLEHVMVWWTLPRRNHACACETRFCALSHYDDMFLSISNHLQKHRYHHRQRTCKQQ